jgi:hypothetical protein
MSRNLSSENSVSSRIDSIRHESIKAFKKAIESRSRVSPFDDERPQSRSSSATRGYTGHQPKSELKRVDPPSPIKYKIRGYTGHIPGSAFICGSPLVPSEEIQHEMVLTAGSSYVDYDSSSPTRRKALGSPTCKYRNENGSLMFPHKEEITLHGDTLRPGHKEFISHRYGSLDELNQKYEIALQKLQARGQSSLGLLRIVQSQLSQRVVNYSQQFIRLRKMFEYFDYDDSCTLDEYEFKHFLEMNNLYFDDVQLVALFAHLDPDRIGGIPWSLFSSSVMVPNPKGGTAVLPKSIIRDE